MLQCVMGLDAEKISCAFLVPKAMMAQRLVCAKAKIKANAMHFAIPKDGTLAPRLSSVTEAIYGAYALDWLETSDDLRIEALFLADVLSTQLPTNAETLGLGGLARFYSDAPRGTD